MKNAAYAICHRRKYWQFDDAIMQHLLDVKAEFMFSLSFFCFPHGALTWKVLTAQLWKGSHPSSLSPEVSFSLQLPPFTPINHLLAAYAHSVNVHRMLRYDNLEM